MAHSTHSTQPTLRPHRTTHYPQRAEAHCEEFAVNRIFNAPVSPQPLEQAQHGRRRSISRPARRGPRVPARRAELQRRAGCLGPRHHCRAVRPLSAASLLGTSGFPAAAAARRAPGRHPVPPRHSRPRPPRRNLPIALSRCADSSSAAARNRTGGDGASAARRGARTRRRLLPA